MARCGRQNADEALALALAAGQTLHAAAINVGVSERTAARRWATPAFRLRVSQLRGELIERGLGRLAESMAAAGDVLRNLFDAESESVRLGAARSVLELGLYFAR
jgi:hypothetical protein